MEGEEVEYDSDHIDEETESRLYSSVFYDDDVDEDKRYQSVTLPTKSSRSFDAADSSSCFTSKLLQIPTMNNSGKDSLASVLQESVLRGRDVDSTLIEALYLTITGNTPRSVVQKADERMYRYVEQNGADEHPVHTYAAGASSDSSFNDDLPPKRQKLDILLGISKRSIGALEKAKEALFEHLEDLPSDGKYWSLDPSDMCSLSRRKRQYRESDSTCERCFKKGHTWLECTRSGPLCHVCAQEGHTVRDCPNKCCSICNEFGHESSRCRNKIRIFNTICSRCKRKGHESDSCPDMWRQYKYTTQPGKPVVVTHSPIRRNKSCFNCGGRGHTGEQCQKPTVDGQSVIQTSIFKFDDCDVYAKESKNIRRNPLCSPCARRSRTYATESTPKARMFDEPLYCSFASGTSRLPQLPLPRASLLKQAGWRKVHSEDNLAANRSLKLRNRTNHGRREAKAFGQFLVDANHRQRRDQAGDRTSKTQNRQTLSNFRSHGALAKSRKRKHPESSSLHDSLTQEKSKFLNDNLSSLAKLKGNQRRKSTVRLRLEKEKKMGQTSGVWEVEDLPNIGTSPYLKLMHTFHIDA